MNIEQELEKLKKLNENKQYKQMLEKIQELLLIAEDPKLYHMRGLAKYMLLDYEGAIKDYDKAIELDPSYTNAYFNRGVAKGSLNDHIGEIEDFNKVIELDPNNSDAYYFRGAAKVELENYKEAIEDYSKAIELNPNFEDAYFYRGKVRSNICSDYVGAIEDYKKAYNINSNEKCLEQIALCECHKKYKIFFNFKNLNYKIKIILFLIVSILGTFIISHIISIPNLYIISSLFLFSIIFERIHYIFMCIKYDKIYRNIRQELFNANPEILKIQVREYTPDNLTENDKIYIENKLYNNTLFATKTLLNDRHFFDEDEIIYISQIVAEWTFYKCVDLCYSAIPREYWDEIIQKISHNIFQIAKNDIKKGIENKIILEKIENEINKIWIKEIDDLISKNILIKEIGENAKNLSYIEAIRNAFGEK